MDQNWQAYISGRGQSFNPYSAGNKQYGGTNAPNTGPVGVQGQSGYDEREFQAKVRRNAMLRRMQATQSGNYMSSPWLKGNQ